MKKKTEFIESIYYLALEMGVADGEVTDLEMNSINRVIHDCMKYSDANNNVFSKKSLVEVNDVKIFTVWMNNFFDNQTMQFLNTHIESLSVLPRETKKLILNAYGSLLRLMKMQLRESFLSTCILNNAGKWTLRNFHSV